jgi:uncharacterized protein
MHKLPHAAAIATAGFLVFASPASSQSQTLSTPQALAQLQTKIAPSQTHSSWNKIHRVVIQVTQNDPAVMNTALNNAENLVKFYTDKGEKIEVEFVAYGAGLNMVRSDTSPVKERLAAISSHMKNVTFTGCGNTLANQSQQENKTITLVPEARVVPTGIARIVELEEQGWTYVRP